MSIRLPGSETLIRRRLLGALREAGPRGAEVHRLARDLDPEEAAGALARLREDGEAVERSGRWTALAFTRYRAAVLEVLEDGDALARPLAALAGGGDGPAAYVPRERLRDARDGDRVLVEQRSDRFHHAAGRRLPEATVVEVIRRRHTTLVGTLEIASDDRRWLVPYDPRNRLDVEVEGAAELLEDDWVVVRLASGGGDDARHRIRGEVVEVLGPNGEAGVDVRVALRHYGIPEAFPEEVLEAAAALPEDPPPEARRGREDLTGLRVVTIDGETARDFDDAVSVERLGGGRFRLGVHIADVAHWVGEGGPLDREAFHRATSVYFPDRAVPMLPERLSNGLCSLRPGAPRLALSAFLDLDRQGRVVARRFAETVIESRRRLTYDGVRRLLEESEPAVARAGGRGDGDLLPVLRDLRELMEILLAARTARGSVDFDLPEGDVTLDTDGEVVGITARRRHVAHRIIEEMMIAANEAVAAELLERGVAALYRVHDAPPAEELEELQEVLGSFGLTLRGPLEELHPRELQRVMREVVGRPEEEFVTTLVLRTLTRALYSPECRGHYALASRAYTHFTSPIRRYPDLVVHRRLKTLLAGGAPAAAEQARATRLDERLEPIAEHASAAERRAERAERDVLGWKKVLFLADRVGERFPGRITGVQPFGLFVRLDELCVDGLVPVRTLGDDYFRHEAERHRLVGDSTGRAFRLGDAVEVLLTGVDELHRGLNLEIARAPEPAVAGAGRKRRRR